VGGIDAYILHTPDKKLQSDLAIDLRGEMVSRLLADSRRAHAAEQRQQQQRQKQQRQKQQLGLSPAAAAAAAAPA
jgi:hypothetical protein